MGEKRNLQFNEIGKSPLTRKDFIRFGIVGIFIALGGFLLMKREVTVVTTCTDNFACKNCKKFSNCNLPEKS